MSAMTEAEKLAKIAGFGFDRPDPDMPALYRRFEKDHNFWTASQAVSNQLPGLEVDEILRVADTLTEVLRERL